MKHAIFNNNLSLHAFKIVVGLLCLGLSAAWAGHSTSRVKDVVPRYSLETSGKLRLLPSARKPNPPPVVSPAEAVRHIRSGHRVLLAPEAGATQVLLDAMVKRAAGLKGKKPVEVLHPASFLLDPSHIAHAPQNMEVNSFFINGTLRPFVGKFKITPTHLGKLPQLLQREHLPHTVFIKVSPPDKHGMVSLGPGADVVADLIAHPRVKIIAEMNPNVPRTRGDSQLHVSHIDMMVQDDAPIQAYRFNASDPVAQAIGKNVAALIPRGATLQFGIGELQEAVGQGLIKRQQALLRQSKGRARSPRYRFWTEIASNVVMDMAREGLIARRGDVIQAGFALGDKDFYDFLAADRRVKMVSTRTINDPHLAGAHKKFIAVNSGLKVDLSGQVCAEMIPKEGPDGKMRPQPYSGVGGQVDFFRAAIDSKLRGGQAILTLRSTARGGTISSISLDLSNQLQREGAKINQVETPGLVTTTSRYDMDKVVTEWGVAELYGKNTTERALALVKIAHPKFRAELARRGQERMGGSAAVWKAAARVSARELALAEELAQ